MKNYTVLDLIKLLKFEDIYVSFDNCYSSTKLTIGDESFLRDYLCKDYGNKLFFVKDNFKINYFVAKNNIKVTI